MIDKQVDAEELTERRNSRHAAANATDDGMRIAEDDDEKAVEQSTECSPETEVV